jgi:hypothetical protein
MGWELLPHRGRGCEEIVSLFALSDSETAGHCVKARDESDSGDELPEETKPAVEGTGYSELACPWWVIEEIDSPRNTEEKTESSPKGREGREGRVGGDRQ